MKHDLKTFRCARCGAANRPQALLCMGCGEHLAPFFMAGPGGTQNTCPTCGTENPPGAGFCRNCFTPLPQALEQRQNLSSAENTPPPPRPAAPPPGQSRLSRLAQARLAKEQSQPKSESSDSGSDWLGSLRSEAAAVPLPVDDEDDEAPVMEEFVDTSRPATSAASMYEQDYDSASEETSSALGSFGNYEAPSAFSNQYDSNAGSGQYQTTPSSQWGENSGDDMTDFLSRLTAEDEPEVSSPAIDLEALKPSDQPEAPSDFRSLRSGPQTGPLFADVSMFGSAEPEGDVPLFDNNEVLSPPPAPESASDFDPRRSGGTGILPDWLRELNPQSPSSSAPPSGSNSNPPRSQFESAMRPFVPGAPEEESSPGLKPFELDESKTFDGGREVRIPGTEEIGGMPDWLRDISGNGAQAAKPSDETPEWLKDLESQNTTKPQIEGDVPAWLRDISAQSGPKVPNRPTFGDDEVAATLNFAFGDNNQTDPYSSDELPPFEVKPGSLPPEALRTGLTGEFNEMPPLPKGVELPSYLVDSPETEQSTNDEMPPLPALDNLFVEQTAQGDEIPFSLPPLPDMGGLEAEGEEENSLWGGGLAPWLRGLEPPSLTAEPEAELPPLSFPVIGIPEEPADLSAFIEEPARPASASPVPPSEPDVAALFEEETTFPNPESLTSQELLSTKKSDGSSRFKETRPFSLRDVLSQTDTLAGKMGFVEEAERRQRERDEAARAAAEPDYNNTETPFMPQGSSFSMSEFNNFGPSFETTEEEETGPQSQSEFEVPTTEYSEAASSTDLPDWLRDQIGAEAAPSPSAAPADWMSSLRSSEVEADAENPAEEMPDWMSSLRSSEAEAASPSSTEEIPDWMSGLRSSASEEESQSSDENVPDWMSSLRSSGTETDSSDTSDEAVPDWMSGLRSSEPASTNDSPDWMSSLRSSGTESEEEPPTEAVPEWLRAQTVPGHEVEPATEQVPDWLRSQSSQEQETIPFSMPNFDDLAEPTEASGTQQGFSDNELPTFDLGEPAEAAPVVAPSSFYVPPLPRMEGDEDEDETELKPFDLSGFDATPSPTSSTGFLSPSINLGEPQEEDLPDWLKSDTGSAASLSEAAPKPSVPPASPTEELPPWLASMGGAQAAPPSAPPPSPAASSGAEAEEMPPWLEAMSAGQAAPPPAAEGEEMPPWLQSMVGGGGQTPAAPPTPGKPEPRYSSMFAGVSRAEEQQADLPDWLKDSGQAAPAPSAEPAGPSAEDPEIDRLLQDLNTVPPPAETTPAGLPDWLREQKAAAEPKFELPEDLPDWLKEDAAAAEAPAELELPIKTDRFITETPGQSPASTRENGGQIAPASPFGTPGTNPLSGGFLEGVEAPAWMRNQAAEVNSPAEPALPLPPVGGVAPGATPSALPGWLRTVGPTAAVEQETLAPATESYSAPGMAVPQVDLPPRLASAEVLAVLLGGAGLAGAVASQTPSTSLEVVPKRTLLTTSNLVRYVLYALLILVTAFALFQPLAGVTAPTVTPPVQGFYDTLNTLKPNDKVLVAYDWEGDRSGEMLPMSQAVTQQIMKHRARIVTVSLNSQGPALASQVTDAVATQNGNNATGLYNYGVGYLNLGWRPGNEAALRSLYDESNFGGINDYRNGQNAASFQVMQGIKSINDFDVVVVLAGDEGSVRTWIEQFDVQPGKRLIFGTTAAVSPMARPYLYFPLPASAQPNVSSNYPRALGLIDGISGTVQYAQLLRSDGVEIDPKLNLDQRLSAQSLAILLLVAAVIVANVVYVIRRE